MSVLPRTAVLAAALFLLAPLSVSAQSLQPQQPAAQSTEPTATAEHVETAGKGSAHGRGRLKACRADAATLCPDAAKGTRRQCLESNQAKLSPECQTALANTEGRGKHDGKGARNRDGRGKGDRAARREACRADVQTLCSGAEKGSGAIGKCLRENVAKLSPGCAEKIQSRQKKAQN